MVRRDLIYWKRAAVRLYRLRNATATGHSVRARKPRSISGRRDGSSAEGGHGSRDEGGRATAGKQTTEITVEWIGSMGRVAFKGIFGNQGGLRNCGAGISGVVYRSIGLTH